MRIDFKELKDTDIELHKELIYVALWDHPDDPRRPRSVLKTPVIEAYYKNWGQNGDIGLLAFEQDNPVGFVQLRVKECVTEEYSELPELAISLSPEYQGRGIAKQMCNVLFSEAKKQYSGIRLGVNPKNTAAITLYKKLGFRFYAQPEGFYPQMVLFF